jgi:hypothetical protein
LWRFDSKFFTKESDAKNPVKETILWERWIWFRLAVGIQKVIASENSHFPLRAVRTYGCARRQVRVKKNAVSPVCFYAFRRQRRVMTVIGAPVLLRHLF